ncbi:MAG: hypothetical protein Kow00127_22570 [Bacteroidales bacterium]
MIIDPITVSSKKFLIVFIVLKFLKFVCFTINTHLPGKTLILFLKKTIIFSLNSFKKMIKPL